MFNFTQLRELIRNYQEFLDAYAPLLEPLAKQLRNELQAEDLDNPNPNYPDSILLEIVQLLIDLEKPLLNVEINLEEMDFRIRYAINNRRTKVKNVTFKSKIDKLTELLKQLTPEEIAKLKEEI